MLNVILGKKCPPHYLLEQSGVAYVKGKNVLLSHHTIN